jgi:hypothetical protein
MAGEAVEYALVSRLNANLTFERDSTEHRRKESVAVVAAVSTVLVLLLFAPGCGGVEG